MHSYKITHSCEDILITIQTGTFSWHASQGVTDAEKATFDELNVLITESVCGRHAGCLLNRGEKASAHQPGSNKAFKTGFGESCWQMARRPASVTYPVNENTGALVNNDTVSCYHTTQ